MAWTSSPISPSLTSLRALAASWAISSQTVSSATLRARTLGSTSGQGVFRWMEPSPSPWCSLATVPDVTTKCGITAWQNSGVIQLSIPLAELGGLQPGDLIRLGAVVAGEDFGLQSRSRSLDTGFLGREMAGAGLAGDSTAGWRCDWQLTRASWMRASCGSTFSPPAGKQGAPGLARDGGTKVSG